MLVTKKYVGDIFLHVGDIPIGHQHHYIPECDVGDWYLMLVPNSRKSRHVKIMTGILIILYLHISLFFIFDFKHRIISNQTIPWKFTV